MAHPFRQHGVLVQRDHRDGVDEHHGDEDDRPERDIVEADAADGLRELLIDLGGVLLGFGVQIPTPSWGNMLEVASGFYTKSWWNVFLPGFLIYITVLAINLVGIGLRDALDPRLNN